MFFGGSRTYLLRSFLTMCEEAKTLRFIKVYAIDVGVGSILSNLKPYHLRYLEFVCVSTRNTFNYATYKNTAFPQALTRFYHLQVLDMGISGNLSLPTGMNNLVNLRHLIAHEKVHYAIPCVSNMTSLQELKFKVQNVGNFDIRQLQPMNQLVTLGISQLENVKNKEDASGASLIDKEHLEELSLSWDNSSMSLEPTTERTIDVLEGLEPHQNLKHLLITGYSGATSPTWLASNIPVTSLQILHLENCREWRILGSLEMLPLLRKLTLVRMCNLTEVSIPSLEELVLTEMPKLEKCFGTYGVELTFRLRVLTVKNCSQLNEFTLFQSDSSFQVEQKSWFPSLTKLTISHCPHIIKWEILPLEEMRALKELELTDVHGIKVLLVPSLEELVLIEMPSLESCSGLTASPPLQFSPSQREPNEWVSRLRTLNICDCPNLIVSHPLPPTALISELSIEGVPTFPTMKMSYDCLTIESNELSVLDDKILAFHNIRGITSLDIQNCPNLVSLSSECSSQLTALETLKIEDCPNLVSLSFGGFRQPINLCALEIINCSNLLSSYTIPGDIHEDSRAQASCPLFPSLTRLEIKSCGIAGKWLTKMLPHVQALEELYLQDCPQIKSISIYQPRQVEESNCLASECLAVATTCLAQDEYLLYIPSIVLSSLKKFYIGCCPELQFCGSKEGFGAFVSLVELSIWSCPKLLSSADERFFLPSSLIELRIQHLPTKLQPYFLDNQTSLRKLKVEESPNLESLRLESCTALEHLVIKGCEQLAVLEGLQFLCSLRFLGMYDVGWKSLRLESCTALRNLKIKGCEQLAVLEGLQYLGSLRSLGIEMNPELSAAWDRGSQEQNEGSDHARLLPPSVEMLEIYDLREEILPCFLAQVPSLPILLVSESPNLTSLQLGSCTALVNLQIRDCKSLNSLNSLQPLRNLTVLGVRRCPRVQIRGYELCHRLEEVSIDDPSALTTSFCEHLTSLQRLEVCGGEVTRQLTDEQEDALQLLTSLRELQFLCCSNLVDLPAGLHSLPSLKRLVMYECLGISRLPEKGLPPSLEQLYISCCSEELNAYCSMLTTSKLKVTICR